MSLCLKASKAVWGTNDTFSKWWLLLLLLLLCIHITFTSVSCYIRKSAAYSNKRKLFVLPQKKLRPGEFKGLPAHDRPAPVWQIWDSNPGWPASMSGVHGSVRMLSGFSRVCLFSTLWTLARQAPPAMGFSRRKYWSGMPCPSPGGRPDSGLEPTSPALQVDSSSAEPCGKPNHVRYYGSFRAKVVSGIKGPPRSASPSLYPEPSPPALSSLQSLSSYQTVGSGDGVPSERGCDFFWGRQEFSSSG